MLFFAGLVIALPRLWLSGHSFVYSTKPHVLSPAEENAGPDSLPDDRLVLLSLSGGGSRAAVFAAAVMKELQHENRTGLRNAVGSPTRFLDEVDVISSVSGGSLAAAYVTLHYDELRNAKPGSDGSSNAWERFQNTMAQDFRGDAVSRLLWRPWRVVYLAWGEPWGALVAEALDELAFDGAKLGELPQRPVLLVNATEVALGPFVFSNVSRVGHSATTKGCGRGQQLHLPFVPNDPIPLTLQWANIDASAIHLSQAVYASAAVPGVLTPVLLRAYDSKTGRPQYLKLIDGGVWDNTGATMLYSFTEQVLSEHCNSRSDVRSVSMIHIDASNVANLRIDLRRGNETEDASIRLSGYLESDKAPTIKNLPEIVDLIYQRREDLQGDYYAATYRKLLCDQYNSVRFDYNSFALYDLRLLDIDTIKAVLQRRDDAQETWNQEALRSGLQLWSRVTEIRTDFRVSDRHRRLLELAAALLVESGVGVAEMVQSPTSKHVRGWCSLVQHQVQ
jgi:predicted acylesterase/phospholipase RssA